MRGIAAAWVLVCVGTAWAQNSLVITKVANVGLGDTLFAPSSVVYIYGTFPHGAGRDFSINVGGATGVIKVADNTVFITAQIPLNAPLGDQTLTVSYLGATSNAFPITL